MLSTVYEVSPQVRSKQHTMTLVCLRCFCNDGGVAYMFVCASSLSFCLPHPISLSCKGVRTAKTGSRATKHDPKAEQEKEKEEAKKKAEKRQARLDAAKAGGAVV